MSPVIMQTATPLFTNVAMASLKSGARGGGERETEAG
jgi:hypothetical protein